MPPITKHPTSCFSKHANTLARRSSILGFRQAGIEFERQVRESAQQSHALLDSQRLEPARFGFRRFLTAIVRYSALHHGQSYQDYRSSARRFCVNHGIHGTHEKAKVASLSFSVCSVYSVVSLSVFHPCQSVAQSHFLISVALRLPPLQRRPPPRVRANRCQAAAVSTRPGRPIWRAGLGASGRADRGS